MAAEGALAAAAAAAAGLLIAIAVFRRRRCADPRARSDGNDRAVVLHQYPPSLRATDGLGLSASPFCAKAELLLRWMGVPHSVQYGVERGANGRLPYATLGADAVADSSAIAAEVVRRGLSRDLDAHLSPAERAVAVALQRMMEEHLYFHMVRGRWVDDAGWAQIVPAYGMDRIPWPLRPVLLALFRRNIRRNLVGQGVACMAPEHRLARIAADVGALAAFLGDKPYLMGARRSAVDATLFALARCVLCDGITEDVSREVRRHANIVAYVERLAAEERAPAASD